MFRAGEVQDRVSCTLRDTRLENSFNHFSGWTGVGYVATPISGNIHTSRVSCDSCPEGVIIWGPLLSEIVEREVGQTGLGQIGSRKKAFSVNEKLLYGIMSQLPSFTSFIICDEALTCFDNVSRVRAGLGLKLLIPGVNSKKVNKLSVIERLSCAANP